MIKSIQCVLILLSFFYTSSAEGNGLINLAVKELQTKNKPENTGLFKPVFHFPPVNQDTTNACWSFATLSFLESEMQRIDLKPVKLAMMYPVYFSFIEKARHFIHTKGQSRFAGGDLFSGVFETIKKYGIVPHSAYRDRTMNLKFIIIQNWKMN